MKALKLIISPNTTQVKIEKTAELKKIAKKLDAEIITNPEGTYDFFIAGGAFYFANIKK